MTDLGSGRKVASIRRSYAGREQVEITGIRDKMRAVVFLTAYRRNRGFLLLRGRSSPVLSICLTSKPVARFEMPDNPVASCPEAPHISHTPHTCQPRVFNASLFQSCCHPTALSSLPQTPFPPIALLLSSNSFHPPLPWLSQSCPLFQDNTVLLLHKSSVVWHLQLHLLHIFYFPVELSCSPSQASSSC